MITVWHRLIDGLFTIWLATTLAFFALRILPGDAIQSQLIQSGASADVIEQRRIERGLQESILLQYGRYLALLVQGDLGHSLINGQPVTEIIALRLPPTLELSFCAIAVAAVGGLLMGAVVGIGGVNGRGIPILCNILINIALSTPVYWTGTLAIIIFSAQLHWFPAAGSGGLSYLILPAGVLGFHTAGTIARVVSSNIREVMSADYIRTARAKGLPELLVVRGHILRVGLLPTVSVITLQLGFLLSGTVLTESLFVRPGVGRLLLERTLQQDYPVVQGIVLLSAVVYTLLNTLADVIYQYLDPRIAVS